MEKYVRLLFISFSLIAGLFFFTPTAYARQLSVAGYKQRVLTQTQEKKSINSNNALAQKVEIRIQQHKTKLDSLISRLDVQIQKAKAHGRNTTDAESSLHAAQEDLDRATQQGNNAVTLLRTPPSDKSKSQLQQDIKASVADAQKSFVQVVHELRLTLYALRMAK